VDRAPREVFTGSAGRLHCIDQRPMKFASREEFDRFNESGFEKLFMSVRLQPALDSAQRDGGPGDARDEWWLILEHGTCALSSDAATDFMRYWRVVKPLGAFATKQLLGAVAARAEEAPIPVEVPRTPAVVEGRQ
jgi:hypothetical protein